MPVPQEFDDWAATLDQDVRDYADKFPFIGYSQVLDEVTWQADVAAGATVLDLGIGTGNLAGRFLARQCEVYGLDFSPKMLEAARLKFPQLHLALADLAADWQAVLRGSFESASFDAIVSGYTFHHFALADKVSLLLRLVQEHLNPGGCIVIGDISFESLAAMDAARRHWASLWDEEDYWIADESLAACRQAGLPATYKQISSCAGVYAIQPVRNSTDKERS